MFLCPKLGEEPLTLSRKFFLSVHWYRASFSDHVCSLIGRVNISKLLKRNEYWLALPTNLHKLSLSPLTICRESLFRKKRNYLLRLVQATRWTFSFVPWRQTIRAENETPCTILESRLRSKCRLKNMGENVGNHKLTTFRILRGYAYSCTRAG